MAKSGHKLRAGAVRGGFMKKKQEIHPHVSQAKQPLPAVPVVLFSFFLCFVSEMTILLVVLESQLL